jgi:hypothetical protein
VLRDVAKGREGRKESELDENVAWNFTPEIGCRN